MPEHQSQSSTEHLRALVGFDTVSDRSNLALIDGNGKPTRVGFRVEDGKIAEHWDVMAEIPPREAWKNDNGKF